MCAISQPQLRIILPSRSYQKMNAVPGRTLFTSSRQTTGSHLLGDLFASFRVPMSWSHCRLCLRGQGEERNKQARWLGQREKSNCRMQPGACGSQVAPHLKLSFETAVCVVIGKGRKKQSFILKEWETAKRETEPALKNCRAFLYQSSSILL